MPTKPQIINEGETEISMSAETAHLIFKACLKKAKIREERLWPDALARRLAAEFSKRKPTPDLVFLRDKYKDIQRLKKGDLAYPCTTFRNHYFDLLLEFSELDFFELEERYARPAPPADYKLNAFKNNIPPIFKEYQPLENMLWRLQMSLCDQFSPVTGIHGMPGMGKSYLAFYYATVNYLRYPGGCWLIPSSGEMTVRQRLRQFAEEKWELVFSEEEKRDETLAWRKVRKYLEDPYRYNEKHQTLLIFDNVEEVTQSFSDVLIEENRIDHVHLLLTTRTPDEDSRNISWLAAEGLTPSESRELLSRFRMIAESDKHAVDGILERIGGFTLALTMIGTLLDNNQDIGYTDLLSDLETGEIRFLDHTGTQMKNLPGHYQQMALSLLLKPLLKGLDEAALFALEMMACLPADFVPLHWVEELVKREFPASFPAQFYRSDLSNWQLLVTQLKRLSLINATSGNKIVRMHRLLQEVVLGVPERSASVRAAQGVLSPYIDRVLETFSQDTHNKALRWQLPVLTAISEKDRNPGVRNARFANSLGKIQRSLGEYLEASHCFQRALTLTDETAIGAEELCGFMGDLAAAESARGDYQSAKDWTEKAIGRAKSSLGDDHPVLAGLYKELGSVEKEKTNWHEAKKWLLVALNIKRVSAHEEDGELSSILGLLGLVERDLENYGAAKLLLTQAIAIAQKSYGSDSLHLASLYSYMAMVEQNLFNYPAARQWLADSRSIAEKMLEPDHPDLAGVYTNIAVFELETGDPATARAMLLKARGIEEKRYDAGHPVLANSCFLMSGIEQAERNFKAAREWLLQAKTLDEAIYPPGHYRLLRDYSSLGVTEIQLKNYVEAKILLNQVILLLHKHPEQPLANLAVFYSNLGMIESEAGNLAYAEKWLLKAVAANEAKYQPGHPVHALTYGNLAIVYYRRQQYEFAKKWMTQAVEIGERFPEKERLTLGNQYFTLGLTEAALQHFEDAKFWFLKALNHNQLNGWTENMENVFVMSQVGTMEQNLNNLAAAREWMIRSVQLEEKIKAPYKDEELAISYTNIGLIDLYERKYLQAKRWFRQAIQANEALNDPANFRLGMNYFYLGLAEVDTDDCKAGCHLLHKAYAIIVNTLGKDHPTTQQCHNAIRENCQSR